MLDGKGTVEQYVARAKALKMPALALTDHGTISGAYEFYSACKREGIEPVLGEEFYFVPNAERVKEEKIGERFHVVVLARNEAGFRTITNLTHEAHKRYYYKPVIDRPLLETLGEEAQNLVVLSGCAASKISKLVTEKGIEAASEEVEWWHGIFPNFFIELQHHDTEFDRKLNRRLLKLAHRHHLPWVVTNDPHYVYKAEECDHDALLAIQTGANIDDPDRFRFDGTGYHLRSRKEMARAFAVYGDEVWKPGCAASMVIAQDCATDIPAWNNRTWHIPKFPDTDDAFAYLKRLVRLGLRERGLDSDPRYVARAKHELAAFKEVGISNFLLITWDIIRFARTLGRVGPGRGSTCGSLVAYLLDIHKMDPIRYDLLFERFLNIERPKMPDIDSDFEPRIRDRVIAYIRVKYGDDMVMRVAAFQTMKTKSVFQNLARSHGVTPADRNRYTKMLGTWQDEDEEDDEDEDVAILPPDLRDAYPDLASQMAALVGVKRAISRHAAGVLIFDPEDPIRDMIAEQWLPGPKKWAALYDLKTCEKMGLMKQDILGLRTLTTISETVRLVAKQLGEEGEPDLWVPDHEPGDDKVYAMLAQGDVSGVFQMEGSTNARGIVEVGCSQFEDIVTTTSMYRAGPLIAGAPKRWLKNRADNDPRVLHPSLEPILGLTWGEMIYQEQMMRIVNEVAGFSMTMTDEIKEIVRFKDPVRMAAFTDRFVQGCQDTVGMKPKIAKQLWKIIESQSTYLFNRSHAVAYSFLTYQTARLKMLYPLAFTTALIRTVLPKNPRDKSRRVAYLGELRDKGFRILPPDVNRSSVEASCNHKRGYLRFGLVDCSGIGYPSAKRFVEWRKEMGGTVKFDDDLIEVNKKVRDTLMTVGACSAIGGPDFDPHAAETILGFNFVDKMRPYRKEWKRRVRFPKYDNGSCRIVGEIVSAEKRKTKNGKSFYSWLIAWDASNKFRVNVWEDAEELFDLHKGTIVVVKGRWSSNYSSISVNETDQVAVLE
jgi:DNA polymerase-3 subunit alpha